MYNSKNYKKWYYEQKQLKLKDKIEKLGLNCCFKKIDNFSNYKIYENGVVFSENRLRAVGSVKSSGYVDLAIIDDDGNVHYKRRCRTVWEAFNGEIPEGYVIHHIDKNRENDRLNNLQLLKNEEHNSLHKTGVQRFGEDNSNHREVCLFDLDGNMIKTYSCEKECAEELGVSKSLISKAAIGKPHYNTIKGKYYCRFTA